ncbi:glycerate kinase family protein [Neolewinella persica]|uniref:glycerate kinase family protein n=1 Tax=Neolewinella persica TaxID=70998 RepID=UPI000381FB0A|nr:glycerate kinase [Neolewinella persica]
MKILIAPDKFKGTLSAAGVAAAIGRVVRKKYPEAEIIEQPLADGGEGSLELLQQLLPLQKHRLEVTGPLRKPVQAEYLMGEGKAYIEVAQAAGLQHVPGPRRDPGHTTTIGVGTLIDDAIARGANDIYLFLGGSATNDCGAGMAAALGYRFFGKKAEDFVPTGNSLEWVERIDHSEVIPMLKDVRFTAVCDVDNPLLGASGATFTYAAQKGATVADLPELERNMSIFADRINTSLGRDVRTISGAGAAGGLGAGCVAFLGAGLRPGIDVLMEAVGFTNLVKGADMVITGEGKIDNQTIHGKVVSGVARAAREAGVPKVIAFCGRQEVTAADVKAIGLSSVHALLDLSSMTLSQAMYRTEESLEWLVSLRL